MVLFWGLVIAAIVALVKVFSGSGSGTQREMMSAMEILEERYARGEIDKGEFEEKSAHIAGRRRQR
jgi:putative membrane protein